MSHNVLNVPVGVKLHADVKSFFGFQGCFRTKWIIILHKCFTLLSLELGVKGPIRDFINTEQISDCLLPVS